MKLLQNCMTSGWSIALSLSSFSLIGIVQSPSALSQPSPQSRNPIIFVQQWQSNDAPGGRVGGAKRPLPGNSVCPQVDRKLTAIVPATKKTFPNGITLEYVQAVTTGEHLTFWFYIPYVTVLPATLSLMQNGDEAYTRTISLPGKTGVIGIQLSAAQAAELKLDQPYQWTFSVICNPDFPSINSTVYGLVKRVENGVAATKAEFTGNAQKPNVSTAYDNAQNYAKKGIWYESLTLLGQRKITQPSDLDTNAGWADLLKAVQLESLAQEPIVQLYIPTS